MFSVHDWLWPNKGRPGGRGGREDAYKTEDTEVHRACMPTFQPSSQISRDGMSAFVTECAHPSHEIPHGTSFMPQMDYACHRRPASLMPTADEPHQAQPHHQANAPPPAPPPSGPQAQPPEDHTHICACEPVNRRRATQPGAPDPIYSARIRRQRNTNRAGVAMEFKTGSKAWPANVGGWPAAMRR